MIEIHGMKNTAHIPMEARNVTKLAWMALPGLPESDRRSLWMDLEVVVTSEPSSAPSLSK